MGVGQQRIWSQTANRLKWRIDQARLAALLLGITTAVLAVVASSGRRAVGVAGQVLSASAAVTAGAATLVQRRVSTGQFRDWTRARSASEGLKTEIYSYLSGGAAYTGSDRDQQLGVRQRHCRRRWRPATSYPGHRARHQADPPSPRCRLLHCPAR